MAPPPPIPTDFQVVGGSANEVPTTLTTRERINNLVIIVSLSIRWD
jgi:hypothetical protein